MAALSAGSAPAYNPVTAAALHQSLLDSTVNNAPKILEGLFVRPSWIREKAAELRRTRSEGDRVSLPPRPLDTVSAAQPPFLQAVDLSTTYVPVANSKRAFRLVQEHWPGDACLFVGNLDNNLSDTELWGYLREVMFRRGLSCKVLVERRKRIRDSTVVARAYVQFEHRAMAETALRLFHKKLDIGNRLVRVEPGKGHLLLAANPSGQPPDPGQAVNALAAAGLTGLVDVYTGSPVQQQDFGGLPCIVVRFPTVARCKHIFQTLRFIRSQPRGAVVQTMGYLYRMA